MTSAFAPSGIFYRRLRAPYPSSPARGRAHSGCTSCCTSPSTAIPGRDDFANEGITAKNLSLWWPNGKRVLCNVSLHVPPGTLAMIAGRNGSGKSTLLHALCSIYIPDRGSVRIQKPCGFVHQDPQTQLMMPTVGVNIALSVPETLLGPDGKVAVSDDLIREKVVSALEQVELIPAESFVSMTIGELSGGQRQRVAVAAALAMKPRTMMFDEVTASMDQQNKAKLLAVMPSIVAANHVAVLWCVMCFRLCIRFSRFVISFLSSPT
jgi:energy-coupling factor transport system ATP-binding protein